MGHPRGVHRRPTHGKESCWAGRRGVTGVERAPLFPYRPDGGKYRRNVAPGNYRSGKDLWTQKKPDRDGMGVDEELPGKEGLVTGILRRAQKKGRLPSGSLPRFGAIRESSLVRPWC